MSEPSPSIAGMRGLQARGLSARRGQQRLFSGLDFDLPPASLVWLRGPNGSGKTTLLRIVAGLSTPEDGQLLWNGQPLHGNTEYRAQLCYLGHTNGLKDDLSAQEALRFLARLHALACSDAQARQALADLGVQHRRHLPVRMLSQGQRKRVALARLALHLQGTADPGLWVLDEPFDALDDAGQAVVYTLLQSQVARGGSVLLSSHIPVRMPQHPTIELVLDAFCVPPARRAAASQPVSEAAHG